MSKRSKRRNTRQTDFKIVVRGVHREKPDHSSLMLATLGHFQQVKRPVVEKTSLPGDQRPCREEGRP